MISNHDRSGYIGASDSRYVMGAWTSKTFQAFWQTKQGLIKGQLFWNPSLDAGNMWESAIGDYLGIEDKDKQIIRGRLRVNLDGTLDGKICEIKTHKLIAGWKPSKAYYYQVQVEMFANEMDEAILAAYALEEEDYEEIRPIDVSRVEFHEYTLDEDFLSEYLPRLAYLTDCLENGNFPRKEEYESNIEEYRAIGRRLRDYDFGEADGLETDTESRTV